MVFKEENHCMSEKNSKGFFSGLDSFLDRQIKKRINTYINEYATKEDGSTDKTLADRIRWEVGRRGETGKQLDIYEPLRWTGIRTVLGVLGAATAKMITDRLKGPEKKWAWGVEIGIIVGTVINSVIDLTRLYPRWLAGLEGGKNTALKLQREVDKNDSKNSADSEQVHNTNVDVVIKESNNPKNLHSQFQDRLLSEYSRRNDSVDGQNL
jgi:hypothetical protein